MTYESVRSLLGPKRTIEILGLLGENDSLNYSDIETEIDTSTDVISNRLTQLRETGLIERTEYSKRDVQYSITEKGQSVLTKLKELDDLLSQE